MIDYKNIIDGWSNYLFSQDPKVLEIAKNRAAICAVCEHSKTHIKKAGVMIPYKHCEMCGCQIDAKVSNMRPDRKGCADIPQRWT